VRINLLATVIAILCVSGVVSAQPHDGLRFDDRIRITYAAEKISEADDHHRVQVVGWIARVDERTVMLVGDAGKPIAVPRSRIAVIERSNGMLSPDQSRRFGAIAGGVIGAVAANATANDCSPGFTVFIPHPMNCAYTFRDRTPYGVAIGGLTGALLGRYAVPSRPWSTVSLRALDELLAGKDGSSWRD
jgi:hypothetical protein